jgi:hypothetical protein
VLYGIPKQNYVSLLEGVATFFCKNALALKALVPRDKRSSCHYLISRLKFVLVAEALCSGKLNDNIKHLFTAQNES